MSSKLFGLRSIFFWVQAGEVRTSIPRHSQLGSSAKSTFTVVSSRRNSLKPGKEHPYFRETIAGHLPMLETGLAPGDDL
jgi:hypothetical protein